MDPEDTKIRIVITQDMLRAGVKFYVCAASLELNGMAPDDLIEDVDNLVGSTFLITAGHSAQGAPLQPDSYDRDPLAVPTRRQLQLPQRLHHL